MENNKSTLTSDQLNKLRHMLGVDQFEKTKRRKNHSYRNHWFGFNEELEKLVDSGVVEKIDRDGVWYRVTESGISIVEDYIGKIKFV